MEKGVDITIYEFKKEMLQLIESCQKIKTATAKAKLRALFCKYDDIIEYRKEYKDFYKKEYVKYQKLFYILKSGKIDYSRKLDNTQGTLMIRDIEQIEISESGVKVITKFGREILLGTDFKFLSELF